MAHAKQALAAQCSLTASSIGTSLDNMTLVSRTVQYNRDMSDPQQPIRPCRRAHGSQCLVFRAFLGWAAKAYRQDQRGTDGGVQRAHAVHNGISLRNLPQHLLVGTREDFMLPPIALRGEVEDAPDGCGYGRTMRFLVYLAG